MSLQNKNDLSYKMFTRIVSIAVPFSIGMVLNGDMSRPNYLRDSILGLSIPFIIISIYGYKLRKKEQIGNSHSSQGSQLVSKKDFAINCSIAAFIILVFSVLIFVDMPFKQKIFGPMILIGLPALFIFGYEWKKETDGKEE